MARSTRSGTAAGAYSVLTFGRTEFAADKIFKWKAGAAGKIMSISAHATFSAGNPQYVVKVNANTVQAARNFPATTTTEVREESNLANQTFVKGDDIEIDMNVNGATATQAAVGVMLY